MDYINIESRKITKITKQLNELLANYQIYSQKLKAFHWNVKGAHFFELQFKFDELYSDSIVKIDEIAERILTLKDNPYYTLKEYKKKSTIKEVEIFGSEQNMIDELLLDINHLLKLERSCVKYAVEINDYGTIEMLSRFIVYREKLSWMFFRRLENHKLSTI
jgi:starvation-inducible DNA-binding protein